MEDVALTPSALTLRVASNVRVNEDTVEMESSAKVRQLKKYCTLSCISYRENTVCSKKSDAKIEITITVINLIRIKYPLSSFNYHLSGANIASFNKIHCTVFEQQLFKKWNSKTEFSNMENTE